MSGENYRSASKSHDPGWNDPPKVAYVGPSVAAGAVTGAQPKPTLNKRVAFPLQNRPQPATTGNVPVAGASLVSQPPHGPPSTIPPSAGLNSTTAEERKHDDGTETPVDREEMYGQVRTELNGAVLRLEENRREEIQKRINLIYESWTAGKLPEPLEKHLHRFASALVEQDSTGASGIHRSIICDYGSKCALWAPALRQLIFALPQPNDEQSEGNVIAKPI